MDLCSGILFRSQTSQVRFFWQGCKPQNLNPDSSRFVFRTLSFQECFFSKPQSWNTDPSRLLFKIFFQNPTFLGFRLLYWGKLILIEVIVFSYFRCWLQLGLNLWTMWARFPKTSWHQEATSISPYSLAKLSIFIMCLANFPSVQILLLSILFSEFCNKENIRHLTNTSKLNAWIVSSAFIPHC